MIEFKTITQDEYQCYMGAEPFTTGELPLIAWVQKGADAWWDIVIDRFGIEVHGPNSETYLPVGPTSERNYSDTVALIERINRDENFIENVQKFWVLH